MNYKRSKKLFSVMCYLCLALVLVSTILEIRWLSAAGLGVLALGFCRWCCFINARIVGRSWSPEDRYQSFARIVEKSWTDF